MTLEEACRLIDPATDLDALAEIEYYNGFKGKDAAAKALHEASQMVVDFVRQMSWHDAKNPPIAHEESWECAGEKHCAVISDIVWVCCESGHTMKGWVENGTWHIEDGHRAEDGHYGHVKLWAPLLEPPEVKNETITVKHEVSPGRESCEFGGDFWGKEVCKYHTFRTQTHGRKAPPEYRKPKCLLFDCWLEQPYKKCEACKKACMEAEYDNGTTAFHG